MRVALGVVAALAAAATVWAGGLSGVGPSSRPDFVAASCRTPANARACAVALRYLAALDLDRAPQACALLEQSTLANAGGMNRCEKTLLQARGIRIHYSIAAILRSPFGKTIRFTTRAKGDAPLRQQMLVSPDGWVIAVIPEP
jgi:hypothetical protein